MTRGTLGGPLCYKDVINYTKENNIHRILTFVDYKKAFDTVNHKYMFKCLNQTNLGKYFCKCVKTLYNQIETCVTINGHFSECFQPTRGIRQGCPISAYLFIIIVEFLANAIRKNPNIQGIKIIASNLKFCNTRTIRVCFCQGKKTKSNL